MLSLFAAMVLAQDLPKPTPQQLAWQDAELRMFVHFAPNTWQDNEGNDLSTPMGAINPAQLDTDQWAKTAKSMGAKSRWNPPDSGPCLGFVCGNPVESTSGQTTRSRLGPAT